MIKFGTDGWRAIISQDFTFENVRKVAAAIALHLKSKSQSLKKLNNLVIIGYDARFLADQFAFEIAKVMKQFGISSFVTERDTPTPIVAWSVKDKKALGAIMLTASHNPSQYCGIKFIPEYAGPASDEITNDIEKKLEEVLKSAELIAGSDRAKIERFEPRERYFAYIEKFIKKNEIKRANMKIVYDPMFGSGRGYVDKLLQRFGCQTEELHNFRDVLFGGHNPEPADNFLGELKAKVLEQKAHLGLANDGDADRFGIVDEQGCFLDANKVISLLFEYLIWRGERGSVVRSVATTSLIDEIAKAHKIKVHETKVGFKYIAQIMMSEKVIIGGEESGGLSIHGHMPEKDGILADLLVVEMIARRKKTISELWKEITSKYGNYQFKREKVGAREEDILKMMQDFINSPPKNINGYKIKDINRMDGVKLILEDNSWLLVRSSGTEPVVRIYYESKDQKVLDSIAGYVKSLI